MMKLFARIGLALMLCLLLTGAARAEEAENITKECSFKLSNNYFKYTMMTDGKYTSSWKHRDARHGWVAVTAPSGRQIHSVYICFGVLPTDWELQVKRGKEWETVYHDETHYAHVYVPLAQGEDSVRLYISGSERQDLLINEISLFDEGEKPDWVQVWEPTLEKADIMFLMAHPDDELIFLGGAIPTYAVERGRQVVVAYYSYSNTTRRSELLNGLWAMGVRNYPVIGTFRDSYQKSIAAQYDAMGGESKVQRWTVELFRKYRPEVVVSHDVNGEYGHPQHKVAAAVVQKAYDQAADPSLFTDSAETYGVWQVKKLYLHLARENQITMDWETPLQSLGGKTGQELAIEAFEYHVTQHTSGMDVEETGVKYDNHLFGLVRSEVGPDAAGGDFLENIVEPQIIILTPAPVQ